MEGITQFFQSLYKRLSRAIDIIDSFFILPFFLPLHIRKDKVSEQNAALYLLFPNGFVWLSIYIYLLHVVLLAFGVTSADVQKPKLVAALLFPLTADPSHHFGTFFFIFFFLLMAFYLYITQMGLWDKASLREYFSEHVPTKEEIRQKGEEKQKRMERRKRVFRYFIKHFSWTLVVLFGIFTFTDAGAADGGMPWFDTFLLSLLFSLMLAPVLAVSAEQKREQRENSEREKKGNTIV